MITELRSVRLYRCLRFRALSGSRVSAAVSSSPAPQHRSTPILPCPPVSRGPSWRCTTVAQGATPAAWRPPQAPQAR
jgi:hypothetical protein